MRYHFAGKQHWLTLGNYPDMSLARVEVQARGLKHPEVPKRYLDKYLLPKLERHPASDDTPADIARLLDEIKARAPTAANDLLRFTRRIFAFGVRRRFLLSNPTADFSPRLDAGGTEHPRSRALSTDELAHLFARIHETLTFGEDNLLAIKLLLALWSKFILPLYLFKPVLCTVPLWLNNAPEI